MPRILEVRDRENSYKIRKPYMDLPMRGCIVGKSGFSGKTNLLDNLLLRPYDETDRDGREFYRGDFKPENIFIVSGSLKTDQKLQYLIKVLDIPNNNLMEHFDEGALDSLYKYIEVQYMTAVEQGQRPEHYLLILDDMSFTGDLKSKANGVISKCYCNGRHIMLSTIVTCQKYTQLSTTIRENCTFAMFFTCSDKQLQLITEDHNFLSNAKEFKQLFRDVTNAAHSFMLVNYKDPVGQGRYRNQLFEPVDTKYKIL